MWRFEIARRTCHSYVCCTATRVRNGYERNDAEVAGGFWALSRARSWWLSLCTQQRSVIANHRRDGDCAGRASFACVELPRSARAKLESARRTDVERERGLAG